MTRKIYLDLDGVMADFDEAYPRLFGHDHRTTPSDQMWKNINQHGSWFRGLKMCDGAAEFWRNLNRQDAPISILTACPKTNYAEAAIQKRQWVYEHLGTDVTVLPVLGGKNKVLFMHAPGDILIDDYKINCDAWDQHGGVSIHHKNFQKTWYELWSELFKN